VPELANHLERGNLDLQRATRFLEGRHLDVKSHRTSRFSNLALNKLVLTWYGIELGVKILFLDPTKNFYTAERRAK
jgi:hypothetical protein